MKKYTASITLNKNSRGCYILDTVKGCSVCKIEKPNGCYGECYAKKIASRYNYDFGNPTVRDFNNDNQMSLFSFRDSKHIREIIRKIKKANMPFIRIGEMGDPSENWEHTINICNVVSETKKPIVIITKHWKEIDNNLLRNLEQLNICINTSISAIDTEKEIEYRLMQYNKLKNHCNSVLRIVSCDFNKENIIGSKMSIMQEMLFENVKTIDTVFRPSKDNELVKNNIINVEKVQFLKKEMLVSLHNKKSYLGYCNNCPDMCGIF